MSHVRNLFHKPSAREPNPKTTLAAPTHERTTGLNDEPPTPAGTALALQTEFAVEEAHLSPETRVAYYTDPRGPAADRYRLLRMRLKEHWRAGKLKKLLITGPLAHDGKSTVLMNLATALAERGKHKVLVIEADLHHASISASLKLRPWAGLTECLTDTISPLARIRRLDPLGWYLLPAGEPLKNPTELLQTPAFGHTIESMTPYFDWILIDSPPVVPLTDSISIQQHVDATLLVVRAGQTPREAVDQTIELLGKKNIVGIVLNGVEARNSLYYQYEYNRRSQED